MLNKEIKEKLEKELEFQGNMYFPEIERFFENNNFNYKGDKTLRLSDNSSIIVWNGWNQEAVDLICGMISNKNNHVALRCFNNMIEVMLSGGGLNLPIAKKDNYKYKKPHWLPGQLIWIKNKKGALNDNS